MPNKPTALDPQTAHDRLAELVAEAVQDAPDAPAYCRAVFDAFRRFAAMPIDGLDRAQDEDMLLAQFGTFSFRGSDEFQVDLTRQIALPYEDDEEPADEEDDDETELWQIGCTLYWPPSKATAALKDGNVWNIDVPQGKDFFDAAATLPGWAWALNEAPAKPELEISFDPT